MPRVYEKQNGQIHWTYGEAGDRFRSVPGDVWQAGPHLLGCGDLFTADAQHLLELAGPRRPDLVYVDPPWNQSNLKAFATKAALPMAGTEFARFLDALLETVRVCPGYLFMEMGRASLKLLRERVTLKNGIIAQSWDITYYRKHPNYLVQLAFGAVPPVQGDPTGLDDEDTPRWALLHLKEKQQLVFDPCLGRGLTLRTAHQLGQTCIGMEFNPRRLAVALAYLAQAGLAPVKLTNTRGVNSDGT
ncbi:MAG TPA: hypothetical protein VGA61_16020 [Anaerolineae bacterium]